MHCQNCGADTTHTLCERCRHEYARQLQRLRTVLGLLHMMATRKYRLTGGHERAGKGGEEPIPVIMPLLDLLDQAEDMLQDACVDAGFTWLDTWPRLIRRMLADMPRLADAPHAGEHLRRIARTADRLAPIVDRIPRIRRIIGPCPACGNEIDAAKGESWRICDQCGRLVNTAEARADGRAALDRYHLTKTPAGLAQWLRENYGYEISRKRVSNWLNRGKLPSSRRVEGSDGYWEFNVREVLTLAMSTTV